RGYPTTCCTFATPRSPSTATASIATAATLPRSGLPRPYRARAAHRHAASRSHALATFRCKNSSYQYDSMVPCGSVRWQIVWLVFGKEWQKNLLTEDVYMCDKTHKHHEIHRIPRRCPTLVFTPGQRAVAVGDRFPIVAYRAMYSRELLSLPAWRGPCQLCLVRT